MAVRYVWAAALLWATGTALGQTLPSADSQPLTDKRLVTAVHRGVDYLVSIRNRHQWSDFCPRSDADETNARTAFTLLYTGRLVDDPRLGVTSAELQPTIRWLLESEPLDTDAVSWQIQALALLPAEPPRDQALNRAVDALLRSQWDSGGFPGYIVRNGLGIETQKPPHQPRAADAIKADAVHTDIAIVALFAANHVGIPVRASVWSAASDYLATWQIAHKKKPAPVGESEAQILDGLLLSQVQHPTVKGDAALAEALTSKPALETLYQQAAAEVIGRALLSAGAEGENFRAAARMALTHQNPDGSFAGSNGVQATTEALFTLARARLCSPLCHLGPAAPAEIDQFIRLNAALETAFQRPLRWQPAPSDVDVPSVLLLDLSKDHSPSDAQLAAATAFIHRGGVVFSHGDERHLPKIRSAIAGGRYAFAPVTTDNFLLHSPQPTPPGALLGLGNGIRWWWVHLSEPHSELLSPPASSTAPRATTRRAHAVDIAATAPSDVPAVITPFVINAVSYISGKGAFHNPLIPLDPLLTPTRPVPALTLARVGYQGNDDPEPGAWPRLARRAAAKLKLTTARVLPEQLDAGRYPIAHLTGTEAFTFDARQIAALQKYLQDGGILLLEAAGSKPAFTASARALAATLLPDAPLARLPLNSPIYNASIPGTVKLDIVTYRRFDAQENPRTNAPRLEGAFTRGHYAIILSPEDFTSGLLGTDTWEISGYSPDSAANLAQNLMLYAAAMHNL